MPFCAAGMALAKRWDLPPLRDVPYDMQKVVRPSRDLKNSVFYKTRCAVLAREHILVLGHVHADPFPDSLTPISLRP